jgi:hypothetical protein
MPCSRINLPGGGVAIVKHAAARHPKCTFCPTRFRWDGWHRPATQLCDEVISKTLGGGEITCDAKICAACAQRIGDKDYCPKHRKEATP